MIGLEGTDGVGKTTLAAEVVRELERRVRLGQTDPGPVKLVHKGPPERDVLEEYATDVEHAHDVHYVFDRWHLGTLVYAPLYRGTGPYGELGVAGFRWVEKFLQARGASFAVVDAPYDVVAARLAARGEDYLQSHHVEGVLERFREVNGMSTLTTHRTVVSPELTLVPSLAQMLVDEAVTRAEATLALRAFPSYVGGASPDVLLVGEKRGGKPPFASEACFMPLSNKSGEYLWESLPDPFWRSVGVANAYEADVGALWEVLGRPSVVALGGKACLALEDLGIPHAQVPHPQYIKRFHTNRQDEYGELIEKAASSGTEHFTWRS